jgi:hypothetical protein
MTTLTTNERSPVASGDIGTAVTEAALNVTPERQAIGKRHRGRTEAASPNRRRRRHANGITLEGRTTTAYPLRDESRRTLGYLRRIVGQNHIPDHATVTVETDRITIEWED